MRHFLFVIVFVLSAGIYCHAQTDTLPSFRLFLIGDAGENDTTGATLRDLGLMLRNNPNSTVVFLGDNCYKRSFFGLLKVETGGYDGSKVTQRRVMSQLNVLRNYKGSAYFVPGNHDWWNKMNLKGALKYLKKEQKFIEDTLRNFKDLLNHDTAVNLPENGDVGPVSVHLNDDKIRIIFFDSYRLIIEEGKRRHKDTVLLKKFYDSLFGQIKDASLKREKIILVTHHPIQSKGKHSLPMPFFERTIRRFASSNLNYLPYERMANHIDSLLKAVNYPDIYYVSGHDHSLQYFHMDSLHYIISGAGSRVAETKLKSSQNKNECLMWNEEGFFEIDFYNKHEEVLMHHRSDIKSELKPLCLAGCE